MDTRYIGRVGSTDTGQFAFALSRETGQITTLTSVVVNQVMEHINGPDAKLVSMSEPSVLNLAGKDTYVIRLIVPIINNRLGEVVGGVGCQLSIEMIQPKIEQTIKEFEEVAALSIYTNNGFILASYVPERIGKMMSEAETQFGSYINEAVEAVKAGKEYECFSYSAVLKTNLQIAVANIPLGSSKTTWSIMVGSTEKYIMREVNAMKTFVFILAGIALIVAVVIIYFVLNTTTKPIVKVADTLKDISEGEGDLTRTIAVSSKDEVGDLALFFNKTLEKIKTLIITIKNQASNLSGIGTDLSSNMTETAAAINEITANIQSI
jgi:methyl-accepting chemotaxis protein